MQHMTRVRSWRWAALGLLLAGVIGALPWAVNAAGAQPAMPDGARLASWFDNGQGGRYVLQVAHGPVLSTEEPLRGVVRSDANCQPDELGLSHCHNVIELVNGARLLVVNNHQMARHRCLSPGEPIAVRTLDANWVEGTVYTR